MDGITAILRGYMTDTRNMPEVREMLLLDIVAKRAEKLLDSTIGTDPKTQLTPATVRAALNNMTADELRECLNSLRTPTERAAGIAFLRWCAKCRPIPTRNEIP